MLEMPEPCDNYWGKLLPESGTSPRERSVLQSTELKGGGDPKSLLTSGMEMQFGVFPAAFWSCFGPVFPHYAPFPMF